jgi:hypothetical protein
LTSSTSGLAQKLLATDIELESRAVKDNIRAVYGNLEGAATVRIVTVLLVDAFVTRG